MKWTQTLLLATGAIALALTATPAAADHGHHQNHDHHQKTIVINPGKQLYYGGLNNVVDAFEAKTGIKVVYGTIGGCGASSNGLKAGTLNAGAFCCPLNFRETGMYKMVDTSVGRDAVEFVVSRDNPVDNLTLEQIQGIYQGRITNWSEVGGLNAPIVPYAHIMCPNREEVARKLMVGEWDTATGNISILDDLFVPGLKNNDARDLLDEVDMVATIANDANGIGHVSRSFNDNTVVKTISVNGIYPSEETIMDNSYPGTRYLHMGVRDHAGKATEKFVKFLLSEEGQELLSQEGKIFPR